MGKRKRRSKQSPELPEDLITDIISRVPEKDLMRFTCVSKSWCSLINSTDSYLSQLRSQRTTSLPLLIIQKEKYGSGRQLYYNYWLELESLLEDENPNPREIHNPFDHDHENPHRGARVIASCDGLLVLEHGYSGKMVVLNPITKKHHVVPPNPAGDRYVKFIGFGYDHVHGCYKLVTTIEYESWSSDFEDESSNDHDDVELITYNVTNCTWKKSRFDALDDDCRPRQLSDLGEYVEGALYWWDDMDMKKILCFLLAEEEFHKVDLPHFDEVMDDSFLTVFDGRLCLVCEGPEHNARAEFWLMECDYKTQVGSSYSWRWIKFLSILDPRANLRARYYPPDLIPICFSSCENKILFDVGGDRFWYDLGENKFSKLKSCINKFSYRQGSVHVTSWVPRLGNRF